MSRQLPFGCCFFLILSMASLATPALAHHGFQFEYDGSKYVNSTGILTGIEWENPHIYFTVDVKDADGKVTSWRFEGSSVTLVKRSGVTLADFQDNIGKTVTVLACPAKRGLPRGAAESVKLPDGRQIVVARKRYFGDGNTPANDDGKNDDPNYK
jgi:uncharacterized protein DUF6152